MKKVTRCFNCKRIIKLAGSFTAELDEQELVNGRMVQVIKLCRPCSADAGYIVAGITKEVKDNAKE